MGATAHHGFPVPDPTDEARMVRVHMVALADGIDAKVPKITNGQVGTPYPTAPRNGDIHLTYIDATPVAPAPPAAPAAKAKARKATG